MSLHRGSQPSIVRRFPADTCFYNERRPTVEYAALVSQEPKELGRALNRRMGLRRRESHAVLWLRSRAYDPQLVQHLRNQANFVSRLIQLRQRCEHNRLCRVCRIQKAGENVRVRQHLHRSGP
ncbi:MAG: hypothetical protein U0836_14715 [Pirellulales bacterium]